MNVDASQLTAATPLMDTAQLQSLMADKAVSAQAQQAEAARQFEAVMLRQIAREAFEPLFSGSMGSGSGGAVYEYFLTDAIAQGLSQGGGLGLTSVLQQQLTQYTPTGPENATHSSL
ncbi:MAG: hypothetical protein ACFBZ8_01600 [Opitutales bacterium]